MRRQRGFTLIEMMVAVVVFTLVAGAAFTLLNMSQRSFTSETQQLDSFQSARLAYDQMSLDIHSAGYPPANAFTAGLTPVNATVVAQTPFPWSPGYVVGVAGAPCIVPVGGGIGGCVAPSQFDLIIETSIPPLGVQWIRYQLAGTTLSRAQVTKTLGADPAIATAGVLAPYVDNVMNNATVAQMAPIQAQYPGMFPGSAAVPLFTYFLDPTCAGGPVPSCIKEVEINMIVQSENVEQRTGRPRVTTLTGQLIRFNPAQ